VGFSSAHHLEGVFDGEAFEIVVRNPQEFACKLTLFRNGDGVAESDLALFERRSFAVDTGEKDEVRFAALFTVDQPPHPDPIVDEVIIYSLGGTRDVVLTDEGIAVASKLAARELWREYMSAVGHEDPLQDIAWHFENGSSIEHAASELSMSTGDAADLFAEYKKVREDYLLAMMLDAKTRVESQLTVMRRCLSG
jgi:hypothetical protein